MCRAEIGHHHRIAGAYLLRYAQERYGPRIPLDVERRAGEPPSGLATKRGKSVDIRAICSGNAVPAGRRAVANPRVIAGLPRNA